MLGVVAGVETVDGVRSTWSAGMFAVKEEVDLDIFNVLLYL